MCDNRDDEALSYLAGWLTENFPKLPMYRNGRSCRIKRYEWEEIFDRGGNIDKSLPVREGDELLPAILAY